MVTGNILPNSRSILSVINQHLNQEKWHIKKELVVPITDATAKAKD
jgi:hypothetical protein